MTLEVSNIPGLPPCTILRAPMLNPSLLEPTQAEAFSAAPESGWEPCMGPALLATGHGVSPGLGGSEPCPSLACVPRAWPVSPEPSPYHPAAPVPRQSPARFWQCPGLVLAPSWPGSGTVPVPYLFLAMSLAQF